MRIGELAQRAGVSVNRSFSEDHVRAVLEIRELSLIGIPPQKAAGPPRQQRRPAGHSRRRFP